MILTKLNDRGIEVLKLQLLLNTFVTPIPRLRVDGYFDQRTEQAMKTFQKTSGLEPDGRANPKTREALGLNPVAMPIPAVVAPSAPWFEIAVAELGVHEDSRPGKHNARIVEYHKTTTLKANDDETPWCSSFVNWVIIQSGRKGTNNALAKSWLSWGQSVTTPSLGVIVVIRKRTAGFSNATGSSTGFHVGFYVSSTSTSVQILGGNQSDRVKKSNFMLSSYEIKGYRKP
jgi:uncharacterized protein (TIGR02594 family)